VVHIAAAAGMDPSDAAREGAPAGPRLGAGAPHGIQQSSWEPHATAPLCLCSLWPLVGPPGHVSAAASSHPWELKRANRGRQGPSVLPALESLCEAHVTTPVAWQFMPCAVASLTTAPCPLRVRGVAGVLGGSPKPNAELGARAPCRRRRIRLSLGRTAPLPPLGLRWRACAFRMVLLWGGQGGGVVLETRRRSWHWLRNEPRLRCLVYIILSFTLMVYLRVRATLSPCHSLHPGQGGALRRGCKGGWKGGLQGGAAAGCQAPSLTAK